MVCGAGFRQWVCCGVKRLSVTATDRDSRSPSGEARDDSLADGEIAAGNKRHVMGQGGNRRVFGSISFTNSGHANYSFLRPRFLCNPHLSLHTGTGKSWVPQFRRPTTHLMKARHKLNSRPGKRTGMKLSTHRQIFPERYPLCGKRIPCDTGEAFPIIRRIHGVAESPPAPVTARDPETDSPGCTGTKISGV